MATKKLFTDPRYASQTLILPVVGEVTLDSDGSIEVESELADQLIEASKGSLEFNTKEEIKKKQTEAKEQKQAKQQKLKEQKQEPSKPEKDDALIEAIESASFDELNELIPLVEGISKKDIEGKNETQLRKFLLDKIS
jgi:hypothetical protein